MTKKILVCDDEPYILESITYIVKKCGFDLIVAENGQSAIEMARQEKPALIFLDISMPKLSGYEVLKILRSDVETKNIYIIILTASAQMADKKRAFKAGANEYITKPFSPRMIKTKLLKLLEK